MSNLISGLFQFGIPNIAALKGGLDIIRDTDLRGFVSEIQCPVLQIFGKLDPIVPVSVVPAIQRLMRDAKSVVIENASHAPFISHPELFIKTVNEFMHEHRK